jgi:hypothetical protein
MARTVARVDQHDAVDTEASDFSSRAFFSEGKAHNGVEARDQNPLDLFQPLVDLNHIHELLVGVSPKGRLKLGNPITLVSNIAGGT